MFMFLLVLIAAAAAGPVSGSVPVQSTDSIDPIIIIPGVMGSRLYDAGTGNAVWGIGFENLNAFYALDTAHNLTVLHNEVNQTALSQNEREAGAGGFTGGSYQTIINELCQAYPSTPLHFFSYDFRKSNAETAQNLAVLIDDLKNRYDTGRVNLICHSMGGLVAASYIAQFGDDALAAVITIAVPYEGAPSLVQRTIDGSPLNDPLSDWFLSGFFVNTADIRRIMCSSPSAAELMPTEYYMQTTPLILVDNADTRTEKNMTAAECTAMAAQLFGSCYADAAAFQEDIEADGKPALKKMKNAYFAVGILPGQTTPVSVGVSELQLDLNLSELGVVASLHYNALYDELCDGAYTNFFEIAHPRFQAGTSTATASRLFDALGYQAENTRYTTDTCYYGQGDKTVPYASATMMGGLGPHLGCDDAGNPRFIALDADHSGIMDSPDLISWTIAVLSADNPHKANLDYLSPEILIE